MTLELLGFGILFALLIAIPMGIFSALRPNTWVDTAGTVIAVSGVAMPQFFLGMILILVFSIWLGWLPSSGYVSPADNLLGNIKGMILPAISLGSVVAAEIMRQLRSSMLEVLNEEYVQTARAKGVPEFRVIIRHALRNALIPVVTLLGMRIGRLIGGIVIIEVVFSIAGNRSAAHECGPVQRFSGAPDGGAAGGAGGDLPQSAGRRQLLLSGPADPPYLKSRRRTAEGQSSLCESGSVQSTATVRRRVIFDRE